MRRRFALAAPVRDQTGGKGVPQIAEANQRSRAIGFDTTDEQVEVIAKLFWCEWPAMPADEEMIAEGNDPASRLLVTLQRPHDGCM